MKIIKAARERTAGDDAELRRNVSEIIENVRRNGDAALREYSSRFDLASRESLRVSREEIDAAYSRMSESELSDLRQAMSNIEAFAAEQLKAVSPLEDFSPMPGIHLSHRVIPVSSCCCYVPGGNYPLFSTALMLITPARVAGVGRICATTPVVRGTGEVNYKTLVAMDLAGADEIYAIGGAQSIAAFSYGTGTIEPVDMIVGPGNRYVAEAKRQCYGKVGIDFVAGPSEVLIIADGSADPAVIAADLLAQCEHDVNAKGILITTDEAFAASCIEAVESELSVLPTAGVAAKSWADYGEVILADNMQEAIDLSNSIAPEHLELNISGSHLPLNSDHSDYSTGSEHSDKSVQFDNISDKSVQFDNISDKAVRSSAFENPDIESYLRGLYNYGSLFIGGNTAEVFGDYASGTNHTLPTSGAARYTGGVWVGTFLKVCTAQWMTDEASRTIAPLVQRLAEGEGLAAHALAASRRKS